jgi:pilus assembly protein FimV
MQQTTQPTIQEPVQPAPIRKRAELKTVASNYGDLNYGLIKYKDTLFDIANKMRPDDVTTNQMMLALARNNPKAFYNGNINQMKAGFVLRIDDRETLTSISEADAKAEVNRHHVEWIARKSGKIIRQTSEAPASGKVSRGDKPVGKVSAEEQARLKLVAPVSEGAGSGVGDEEMGRMRQYLLLAAEALDANKQETDELKTRMVEMEEQLESMQRLIMLKDDEMMAIQKQFGKEAAAEQGEATPEALLETAPDAAPEAVMGEGTEAMPAEGEAAAEKPAEMAPAPKPKPMPMKDSFSEPSLVDELMGMLGNPMIMYGGIGLLVLILGFVVYKKRQASGDGFEESILNVGATAESMEESNESSMVSDFAMSEMSGMSGISADAADVDPVSEADVYLAYGRHQQAEEILNEALASDPNRHDVKLKLLEVFFAAKNSDSFEKGAQELHDALGDESDPLWAKALTMGQQLCPNNALFGGAGDESSQEELSSPAEDSSVDDVAEASEDDLLDFDFDIDSDGDDDGINDVFAELEAATAGSDVADESQSDDAEEAVLDLDTPIESDDAASAEEKADDGDNSLDFDASDLDFSLDTEDADEKPTETSEADTGLDFDLGEAASADAAAETGDGLGDLSDDVFGEVDEVGTKLDLAKAYVDMGDSDGARSILDEVLEEGDDAQKAQAKELLGSLG